MKKKIVLIVSICCFVILMVIGLINKSKYEDFNDNENAIDNFVVGLLPDELAGEQIEKMNSGLEDCNFIVAAECVDEPLFRFGCITERVKIKKVFKGDNIKAGDMIDVGRDSSCLFLDESMYVNGKPLLNMGFVRAMSKGHTYLIFLQSESETNAEYRLFVQAERFLMAPIFEYAETNSTALASICGDANNNV